MIVIVQDYVHYYCYYTFLSIIIGILCFLSLLQYQYH